MSMIECPECKSKVSEFAKACPKCGFPLEEQLAQGNVTVADSSNEDEVIVVTEDKPGSVEEILPISKATDKKHNIKVGNKEINILFIVPAIILFLVVFGFIVGNLFSSHQNITDFEYATLDKVDEAVSNGTRHEFTKTVYDEAYGFSEGSEFCGMKTGVLEFSFMDGRCVHIYLETTNEGKNAAAVKDACESISERFGGSGKTEAEYDEYIGMDVTSQEWGDDTYCVIREDNLVLMNISFKDF